MGGIAGASVGFFLGGIIGSSSSGSEFDLRGKRLIVKLLIIQRLLSQRNDGRNEASDGRAPVYPPKPDSQGDDGIAW